MAAIRLSDCSEKVRAQLLAKLRLADDHTNLVTYHFVTNAGGKSMHLKSTDKERFAKVLDNWREAHPLIPYVIYATEIK